MSKQFKIGDLVWGKMKGFPYWPGKIIEAPPGSQPKENAHYVYFFGSENSAQLKEDYIKEHSQEILQENIDRSGILFQEAVKCIINESSQSSVPIETSEDSDCIIVDEFTHISDGASSSKEVEQALTSAKEVKQTAISVESSGFFSEELLEPYRKLFEKSFEKFMLGQVDPIPPGRKYKIPRYDVSESKYLRKKNIIPTLKKIGVVGVCRTAHGIIKNLARSGHNVIMYKQDKYERQCEIFANILKRVKLVSGLIELVETADIVINCLKPMNEGENALDFAYVVMAKVHPIKPYVEMTPMPTFKSELIDYKMKNIGGHYLEAQFCGTLAHASHGALYISAAGDKGLYDDCKSCFDAISEEHVFLGDTCGSAIRRNSIMKAVLGNACEALLESDCIELDADDYELLNAVSELDYEDPMNNIPKIFGELNEKKTAAMVAKILDMQEP